MWLFITFNLQAESAAYVSGLSLNFNDTAAAGPHGFGPSHLLHVRFAA